MNIENNFQTPLKQDIWLGFDYGGGTGAKYFEQYLKHRIDKMQQIPVVVNGVLHHYNSEGMLVETTDENRLDKFEKLISDKPSKWDNYKKWKDLGLWYLRVRDYNYVELLLYFVAVGIGFLIRAILWE